MTEYPDFWRIGPEQAGCSAGASTLDNQSALLDLIKKKSDKRMATVFLTLDLRGAYDSCDHNLLLKLMHRRLQENGVDDTFARTFQTHLRNELDNAFILVGRHLVRQGQGVVQGGATSPTIFVNYLQAAYEQDSFLRQKMLNTRKSAN